MKITDKITVSPASGGCQVVRESRVGDRPRRIVSTHADEGSLRRRFEALGVADAAAEAARAWASATTAHAPTVVEPVAVAALEARLPEGRWIGGEAMQELREITDKYKEMVAAEPPASEGEGAQ